MTKEEFKNQLLKQLEDEFFAFDEFEKGADSGTA